MPLRGGRTPNGKCHLKFPFWFFDSLPNGKCRNRPTRLSRLAFPWKRSPRNMKALAVKGSNIAARVVAAHFGLLLSSNSTKVKTSVKTSIAGRIPLTKRKSRDFHLLTTFFTLVFLKNPGLWSSAVGDWGDAKPESDRRLRPPIFTTFVWGRASAPKDWTDWLKAWCWYRAGG